MVHLCRFCRSTHLYLVLNKRRLNASVLAYHSFANIQLKNNSTEPKDRYFSRQSKVFLPRQFSSNTQRLVLGIETSCDDTGCAVVDSDGNVLGEALSSQQQIHLNHGGIMPIIAQLYHKKNLDPITKEALKSANVEFSDLDAIAVTVKPGLALSLVVGKNYAKQLSVTTGKPLIPIHHMEAHALTVRMIEKVDFPFLVLLISGGHALLAVVKSVDKFLLLGKSLDDAPGEAFDKTARRLKLKNLPEYSDKSGGVAMELATAKGNPLAYKFTPPLLQYRDCNFSVAGLKNAALKTIERSEKINGVQGDEIIPEVYDVCASFQFTMTMHICYRVQRAMDYVENKELIPFNNKTLVVSGGVACNGYIQRSLSAICEERGYRLSIPPPKLCTDNGIMIAWNGMERLKAGIGIVPPSDVESVDIQARCPLGEDLSQDVIDQQIKCTWVKQKKILERFLQVPSEVKAKATS